jgi:hypothetical protein
VAGAGLARVFAPGEAHEAARGGLGATFRLD